ncbi:MAG: response regulator, partial [Deltaproteobacteria bacterium]|nr:response regulator [Deltaproteobacteria bacterium]
SVKVVADGQRALDVLRSEPLDVAMLDLNMPVMGGLDAAKQYLMETKGKNQVPIVALTADATMESRKACEEAGIKAFMTKPFETRKILSVLHALASEGAIPQPAGERRQTEAESVPKEVRRGFDEAFLEEIESVGPTKDFVKNLVWIFIRDSEKRIREMESAAGRGDVKGLCDAAHSLKGISGAIGALAVMDICDRLQRMRGGEPMPERLALLADIKEEVARVRKTLIRRISLTDPATGEGSA